MIVIDVSNMYEGVGRMFILHSNVVIHNKLLEEQKVAEETKELEQKKKKLYLEFSVKKAKGNVQEILMTQRTQ